MNTNVTLRGIVVLVADAEPFRRDYVTQVLRNGGALIAGPFSDGHAMLTYLDETPEPPQLAYVGCHVLPGRTTAIVQLLSERGMKCVAVCAVGDDNDHLPTGTIALRPPLAAFQIHQALLTLYVQCASGLPKEAKRERLPSPP